MKLDNKNYCVRWHIKLKMFQTEGVNPIDKCMHVVEARLKSQHDSLEVWIAPIERIGRYNRICR